MSFEDVPPGSPFYEYVQCLYCLGIVSGYPNGTFGVSNPVTRGQMAQFVSKSANLSDPIGGQTFEDVPPGSTFYLFVERLALHEVIEGYPCGGPGEPCNQPDNRPYFRPGNNTSRGQLSKIVCRAFGCEEQPDSQWFEDVPPGSNFHDYIGALYSLNAVNGYPCGGPGEPCIQPDNRPYFRPGNSSSRAQTAKIVAGIFFPNCDIPGR
jgi:hypothetical protein